MRHDAALPDTRRIVPIAAASMIIITTTITSTTSTTGAPPIVFFFRARNYDTSHEFLGGSVPLQFTTSGIPPPPSMPPSPVSPRPRTLSFRSWSSSSLVWTLSTKHVLILVLGPSAPHLFRRHTTLPHSSTSRPAAAAASSSSFPPSPSSFSFRPTPHPQPHSSPVQLTRHPCFPHSPLHPSQNPICNQSVLAECFSVGGSGARHGMVGWLLGAGCRLRGEIGDVGIGGSELAMSGVLVRKVLMWLWTWWEVGLRFRYITLRAAVQEHCRSSPWCDRIMPKKQGPSRDKYA